MFWQINIPTIDPMPLPAPYWLFKILLVLTFLLHILAMNIVLGGSLITAVAKFLSKRNELYLKLSNEIGSQIPNFLAATITLGIAPLLFVQVIYGQYFYTSSIIIGYPWFLVIILLMIGYYLFYYTHFKMKKITSIYLTWAMMAGFLILLIIAFIYSNNLTLMLTPEKWLQKYQADPSGLNLNWDENSLIPRFLHFSIGALAIAGLYVAINGLIKWKTNNDYAKFTIRFGARWFMWFTMLQVIIGFIFLFVLPEDIMLLFIGKNIFATIILGSGIITGIASIVTASFTSLTEDPRKNAIITIILALITVILMVITRDMLRDAYLGKYFDPSQFKVKIQWDVLVLFLVIFLAGLYIWFLMIKKFFFKKA